jgi:hypothetical protein
MDYCLPQGEKTQCFTGNASCDLNFLSFYESGHLPFDPPAGNRGAFWKSPS